MSTFTCEFCGHTLDKARTDEEARAKAEAKWIGELGDDYAVICEDCFNDMDVRCGREAEQ